MILKINDRLKIRTIEYFNSFKMNLKYDSIASSFSFDFYFDPENHDQEELACVSHYHEAIIEHEGVKIMHGYILSPKFKDSAQKAMATFSGYSLTGPLLDCNIPLDTFPLQYDGLSLNQISDKLLKPFGINKKVDASVAQEMNRAYETTTAKPEQTVADYLTELANQRNIIITHTNEGDLLFTRLNTKQTPVLFVHDGLIGVEMEMDFGGQNLHSHITVMKQADDGDSSQYTIQNPFVPVKKIYRPKNIIQTSGDNISVKKAAQNALAAELRNITVTIKVDRWMIGDQFIRPNTIISILNKNLYIYKKTNFFVESVSYEGDSEALTAIITCVLPCCYDGSVPYNIFVDPHKNSATGYTSNI